MGIPAEGADRLEETKRFAGALCNAIAGDGVASEEEISYIQGILAAKSFPDEVVAAVPDMARNSEGRTLEQIAAETKEMMELGTLKFAGRVICYHAIQASAQDGLADDEVVAIKEIGKHMNVDESTIDELIELNREEEAFRKKKVRMIMPNGHPELDKKYSEEGMVFKQK